MRLFLTLIALGLFSIHPASAQDIEACGVPADADISTTPSTAFCDIYQRQLAYRVQANKMRDQINARNEAYAEPRRAAYERYLEDLKALEEERTSVEETPQSTE